MNYIIINSNKKKHFIDNFILINLKDKVFITKNQKLLIG